MNEEQIAKQAQKHYAQVIQPTKVPKEGTLKDKAGAKRNLAMSTSCTGAAETISTTIRHPPTI
jgi:hypothetical protein